VSKSRYLVRPKADRDLDEQAYYYARVASPDVGHRFLVAAHNTFALLATQPKLGWHASLKNPYLKQLRVFRVRDFQRMLILYIPVQDGVDNLRVVHGSRKVRALLRREGLD
jgi:toxin ParE1/3/4